MSWAGSSVSVPTEFWSRLSGLSCFHSGLAPSAFSVDQTPPPETPAQTWHLPALHFGSTSKDVTRLAVLFVAPENDVTPGWVAFWRGPRRFQVLLPRKARP